MVDLPDLAVGRVKQVDEGRSDNYTSTKVSGEEVDNQGNLQPSHTFGQDWEEGDCGRNDQNDKKSRYSCSKMTVVIVSRCIEGANDLGRICGSKIDIARVKVGRERHGVRQRNKTFKALATNAWVA